MPKNKRDLPTGTQVRQSWPICHGNRSPYTINIQKHKTGDEDNGYPTRPPSPSAVRRPLFWNVGEMGETFHVLATLRPPESPPRRGRKPCFCILLAPMCKTWSRPLPSPNSKVAKQYTTRHWKLSRPTMIRPRVQCSNDTNSARRRSSHQRRSTLSARDWKPYRHHVTSAKIWAIMCGTSLSTSVYRSRFAVDFSENRTWS